MKSLNCHSKVCPNCGGKTPNASKNCIACGAAIACKGKVCKSDARIAIAAKEGEMVLLYKGPSKLGAHQEILVPKDQVSTRKGMGSVRCGWCGLVVEPLDSRAEETVQGRLLFYHLGCADAKREGLKPPARLR